ncbi:hypothetical protein H8A99_13330 [Bradyrhizobium sp. Arg68]|uniref:hypothetical protein n=1 Tax=Bradyrhizobium ivorense TaxID=2511166 RepID=UPI001E344E3E|nr:hypothetical protein [Bradyrhizobium ivorense]MCC8937427.1 hypothetical protein [Bradyrhizobium ivorense]
MTKGKTLIFEGSIQSAKRDPNDPNKIIIDVRSEPFGKDPPFAAGFYDAIGRLVVTWGKFEHHLDTILHTLVEVAAQHGISEKVPHAFQKKADVFRRIYQDCPPLAPLKDWADTLMSEAELLGKDRNRIIHSTVNNWGKGDPPTIQLKSYEFQKKQWSLREINATKEDIAKLADKADQLNTRLLGYRPR